MLDLLNSAAPAAIASDVSDFIGPVQPVTAKPAKPRAPKAAKPAPAPAVIVAPEPVAAPSTSTGDETRAAAIAVAAFYTSGPSLPFKAASAKLSDLNFNNAKAPSVRTAALVAAMLAYNSGNIQPDGTFTRGGFRVPAKLINPDAKAGDMLPAMPEAGCLGNMLGRVCSHVSGPIGGKQARDGVFKLDFDAARRELQQLGDTVAKPALAVLNKLAPVAKPAKRAKADA
jgi:hypothetical protein